MPKGPGKDFLIAFDAEPQITRAIVNKQQIRFEIQVPNPSTAVRFAKRLASEFKLEFRVTETGIYENDPCPFTVALDENDKARVVATYSLEGWTPKHSISRDAGHAVRAFEEAGIRMSFVELGTDELNANAKGHVEDAFVALEKLSSDKARGHVEAEIGRREALRRGGRTVY